MGSRHTKASTKPLPTGGIITLSAAATKATYLPKKNNLCQQRFALAAEI
ncbi:MAG: hypothetical protein ACFN0J_05990 [Segatella salivae]